MCSRLIAILLYAILAQEKFHSNTLSDSEGKLSSTFLSERLNPSLGMNKSYIKLMTVIRVW